MTTQLSVFEMYARKDTRRVSTGIIILDVLLGGGFPVGDYVELCSDTGLGKSTMAAQIARTYAKTEGWVLVLDYEHAWTDGLIETMNLGKLVDADYIRLLQPITYGDGEIILDMLPNDNLPSLIIFDSATAMLVDKQAVDVQAEIKTAKQAGDKKLKAGSGIGAKARSEAAFMIKYKGWARKNEITCLYVNQIRTHFTTQFKAYEDSAGGNAFKFYCDVRLYMRRTADIKRQENTIDGPQQVICGNEVKVRAKKNRGHRSHIDVPMEIYFGKGVSNYKSIANVLVGSGAVVQSGSYFKIDIGDTQMNVQGWAGLIEYVKSNTQYLKSYIQDQGLGVLTKGEI